MYVGGGGKKGEREKGGGGGALEGCRSSCCCRRLSLCAFVLGTYVDTWSRRLCDHSQTTDSKRRYTKVEQRKIIAVNGSNQCKMEEDVYEE